MPNMDGYPTRDELQAILDFEGTPHEFFDYICSIWKYDMYAVTNGRGFSGAVKRISISTAGWSGNEEIIGVLQKTMFWMLWWQQSRRGGHYIFEVPTKKWWDSRLPGKFGLPHSKVDQ